MAKTDKYYVIQDCVECDDKGEYSFKCDANVRLTLQDAVKKAWEVFLGHYTRLAGHPPADDVKRALFDAMAAEGRTYCLKRVNGICDITLEILERSAS